MGVLVTDDDDDDDDDVDDDDDDDDDVMGGLVTDPRRLIRSHNPSAHQFRHAWEPDDDGDDHGDQCYF